MTREQDNYAKLHSIVANFIASEGAIRIDWYFRQKTSLHLSIYQTTAKFTEILYGQVTSRLWRQ